MADRDEAGRRLAEVLAPLRGPDLVVLGLPRGGVPVAAVVAWALHAPLDVLVVRKLGVPSAPEVAMGAIGEGGVRVVNEPVLRATGLSDDDLRAAEAKERAVLEERVRRFRPGRQPLSLTGRTAVIVDDGMATGSTAVAAARVARALGARRIVVAVPVAAPQALGMLSGVADEVVCLETPDWFVSVGSVYRDFTQVSDDEVRILLESAARRDSVEWLASPSISTLAEFGDVDVPTSGARLSGSLVLPEERDALVVLAHAGPMGRSRPRNRYLARRLQQAGLGTLSLDLTTPVEAADPDVALDADLLGVRLLEATAWLRDAAALHQASVGYLGDGTAAAAALWAAADPRSRVRAVVSRGGRPDLVFGRLGSVVAPTLLVVGGEDRFVLEHNRHARDRVRGDAQLVVISGAGHAFEEPGAWERAADLSVDWLRGHLVEQPRLVG